MCTSYETNPNDAWDVFSVFSRPDFDYRSEIYKDYFAPTFRSATSGVETVPASFRMVPRHRIPSRVKPYDAMNARSDSIGERRSFPAAWNGPQFCLIPRASFFEPNSSA